MMAAGSSVSLFLFLVLGAAAGVVLGWLWAGRSAGSTGSERDVARAERDKAQADFRAAIVDLEAAVSERDQARIDLAALMAEQMEAK